LKTVQTEGESRLGDVKAKVQQQLDSARRTLGQLQATVKDGAKAAVDSTDAYVRDNPWRAVGAGVALGALIGFPRGTPLGAPRVTANPPASSPTSRPSPRRGCGRCERASRLLANRAYRGKAWAVRFLIVRAVRALPSRASASLLAIFALVVWGIRGEWPRHPGLVRGRLPPLLGVGGLAYIVIASKQRHPVFEETIAVLKGDEQALRANLGATGD
jgi:ElaB/YqjD/DUF883 family membrane-anchored ribosome-binding protein